MAKHWFPVFLLLLGGNLASAQLPKYFIKDPYGHGTLWDFGLGAASTTESVKYQSLYTPSDFPGAPSGVMTNMFVRVSSQGGTMPDFGIKIGYTTKLKFVANVNKSDTFINNLYTVFSRPGGYGVPATDTPATWIKIPLDAGNFFYDKAKGFAVELAYGPPATGKGFCLYAHNTRPNTCLVGRRDSAYSKMSGSGIDFGFDIATTSVDHVSNLASFGLFPNPTVDGRFNVSFDAKQPVADVLITIFSLTGELVLSESYPATGKSFFKEVDLNGLAKGTYVVKVVAGGESITRSVVVP